VIVAGPESRACAALQIARTRIVDCRASPRTSIRPPVGLPTLAVLYGHPHVLAPTVEAVATDPDCRADR
jgi:hypothetical protein